ncbi:MAG: HD domain-containing protein [Xanthomonadaceae bacterium]|jgi:guanosine-3',5'-bis(diphosphate) 3'-pyrophosphohydrolase|nr:HD domain-containing protein [Xanthomonadaceae bacterium]
MTNPASRDTRKLVAAMAFAAERHRGQRRKDAEASPHINHSVALAAVLADEGGIDDADVLCAARLHGIIEDTDTTADEIAQCFGNRITDIALEASDDKSLAKDERKRRQIAHAPRLSHAAKLVKRTDKICNLCDILTMPLSDRPLQRRQAYFDWAAAVVDGLRGVHPELERIFDGPYVRKEAMA